MLYKYIKYTRIASLDTAFVPLLFQIAKNTDYFKVIEKGIEIL